MFDQQRLLRRLESINDMLIEVREMELEDDDARVVTEILQNMVIKCRSDVQEFFGRFDALVQEKTRLTGKVVLLEQELQQLKSKEAATPDYTRVCPHCGSDSVANNTIPVTATFGKEDRAWSKHECASCLWQWEIDSKGEVINLEDTIPF